MSCGSAPEAVIEDGEALMPKRRHLKQTDPKQCVRCHTVRGAYILRSLPYCQACFQSTVRQRIIRNLFPPMRSLTSRKSAVMRPPIQPGQVLIAVSGGAGSMAMLDYLETEGLIGREGEERVAADKTKGEKEIVWTKGTIVYVEFSGVTGMEDRTEEMEVMARGRGLAFLGVRAEEVFDQDLAKRLGGEQRTFPSSVNLRNSDLPIIAGSSTPPPPLTRLQTLLSSLPPASRPSLLQNILDHILNLAARYLPNVSHLLLGETSTREAQRVISATALGRGWALPLELSGALHLDASAEDEKVLRLKPMKEITLKEAAIHCHLRRMPTVNQRQWVDGRSSGGRGKGMTSLEMLTEQFIAGLSVTHPSTVSTINKTGDKLVFTGDKASKESCPLCQTPAEPSAQVWKSRTALTSLRNDGIAKRHGQGLASLLCYACLTTMTPSRGKGEVEQVDMPLWVGEEMYRRIGTEEMERSIGSFLIPEGD